MNQKEIYQNMTKGEWTIDKGQFNDNTKPWMEVVSKQEDVAIARFDSQEHPSLFDAAAIVTAVNFWADLMSKGINPEAVEGVVECLRNIVLYHTSLQFQDQIHKEYDPIGLNAKRLLFDQAQAALDAAKL